MILFLFGTLVGVLLVLGLILVQAQLDAATRRRRAAFANAVHEMIELKIANGELIRPSW